MAKSRQPVVRREERPLAGTKKLQTVGDWLRFAVTTFTRARLAFAQGLRGPQEEAMFLVGRFLGLEPDDVPHFLNARLTRREIDDLRELIRRRVSKREPIAYLLHEAWLGGHRFYVDERVLIPRSYIAELIPEKIRRLGARGWNPRRILDLGTGSGCLAIIAAHAFPDASVDAVDLSTAALEVAAENIRAHGLEDRVHTLSSDLFAAVPPLPYDLVLANPPYEPGDVVAAQPPELAHEPALALDGGADGMHCVRRILTEAHAYLAPRGLLVLEVGGLLPQLSEAFPDLKPHVFKLADGSDAVVGLRASQLRGATD